MLFTKTDKVRMRSSAKLDYLSPAKVYDIPSLEDPTFQENADVMVPGRPSMLDNPLELLAMN